MFTARFVIGDLVFISDPALIKEVFRGDPDTLRAGEANAPPLEPIVGRNSALTLDGPEHLRQRKLMLPSFHGERIRRYGDADRARSRTTTSTAGRVGAPFRLRDAHAGDDARGDHADGVRDRGRGAPGPAARHAEPDAGHRATTVSR